MKMFLKDIDKEFINACADGDLARARYLLTSPKLLTHANIQVEDNLGLFKVSMGNHVELAEYLLTSEELSEHANIHAGNDHALSMACCYGNLEMVQFYLTSPELKEHAKLTENAISFACINNQVHVLEYLKSLFDLNEYINTRIFKTLIDSHNEQLLSFFIKDCNIKKTVEIENFLMAPYETPKILYIGSKPNYLGYEILKKKALNMFQ
jgi:hypothetical protein